MSNTSTPSNPQTVLEHKSRDELNIIASKLRVPGYRPLTKEALIKTLLGGDQQQLLKQLKITWWDRHHNHVYGTSTVVGVVLTVVFFLWPNGDDKAPTRAPTATTPSSESASVDESQYSSDRRYLPMTLKQYHNRFHDPSLTEYQRLAMTEDYLGRVVIWEGYIFNVSPVDKFTDDIGLSITPELEYTRGLTFVEFDNAYNVDFRNVTKGQRIRFAGIIADKRDPGPLVVDSTLLRVYEPEAEAAASTEEP